jgi:hypothetical protein
MSLPGNPSKPWNIVAIAVTAVSVALIASFTVVIVTSEEPDVFLQFLAGPFLGNLGTFIVLIITAVTKRQVNTVAARVDKVEKNTNGTTTALFQRNNQLAEQNRELRVQAAATDTETENQ